MIKKYQVRISYREFTYNTLNEAIEFIKTVDKAEEQLDVELREIQIEGEPIAEAVRTGLNDDYPDNL